MPSIYGKDIPTGKSGPQKEERRGSPLPKEYPNYLCNRIESYIVLCLLGYDHRPIDNYSSTVNYLGLRQMNHEFRLVSGNLGRQVWACTLRVYKVFTKTGWGPWLRGESALGQPV